MSDLLDETLDELREQKLHERIYKAGKWFGGVAALFLIGALVYNWWTGRAEELNQKRGSEFMEAVMKIRAQDVSAGIAKFEQLIEAGDTNYSALAALHYAAILSYKKDFSKAAEVYGKLSETRSIERSLRDYARYMQLCSMLIAKTDSVDEVIIQLDAYINSKPAPTFKASAQEMQLALYVQRNDAEKVKEILAQLDADNTAPLPLKQRARDITSVLSE